jgi:hypothetical protein
MCGNIRGDNERCPADVFSSSQWLVLILEASLGLSPQQQSMRKTKFQAAVPVAPILRVLSRESPARMAQTRMIPHCCLNCTWSLPWTPLTRSTLARSSASGTTRAMPHEIGSTSTTSVCRMGVSVVIDNESVVRRENEKWAGTRDMT